MLKFTRKQLCAMAAQQFYHTIEIGQHTVKDACEHAIDLYRMGYCAEVKDYNEAFPLGAKVRKINGPQWEGVIVGYYSSSFTPEGLVVECTVPGALGQVHVEPAKRMEVV